MTPTHYPGCGRLPAPGWHCSNCYDPVDDCSELERLRGTDCTSWNEACQAYLDGLSSAEIQRRTWAAAARHEKSRDGGRHQRLERLLRDETTRRHHECLETIPPPPSVPREERETVRPARMNETRGMIR